MKEYLFVHSAKIKDTAQKKTTDNFFDGLNSKDLNLYKAYSVTYLQIRHDKYAGNARTA